MLIAELSKITMITKRVGRTLTQPYMFQCCIGCRRCGGYNISYRMKQYNPILTIFLFLTTLGAMLVCNQRFEISVFFRVSCFGGFLT